VRANATAQALLTLGYMNAKHVLSIASLLLLLGRSGTARAQNTDIGADALASGSGAPPHDWRISGVVGGFANVGEDEGGAVLGANAKVRSGWLVGGALLEFGGALFAYNYVGAAALGGIGTRVNRHVRLELLGAAGYHYYSDVGRDFLWGEDPGASGGLPFVGGRAGASYLFGKRQSHFELGLYGNYDHDLYEKRVRYSYVGDSGGFFGGDGDELERYTSEQTLGWSRVGLGVELGGTHDWF
jgi:hypothetical protein